MNGTSGFPTGGGKLCRVRPSRKAQFEGQGQKFRKLSTQNPVLRTADRFLHEQQILFGTGAWGFPHAHDLNNLSAGINTKREMVPGNTFIPTSFQISTVNTHRSDE